MSVTFVSASVFEPRTALPAYAVPREIFPAQLDPDRLPGHLAALYRTAMYRDAVIAVDVLGLSYREAACSLNVSEATLTSRLHRGRQRVTRLLLNQTTAVC